MSSIPSHNPGPILSRGRKLFLAGLVVTPLLSYAVLKRRQNQRELERRLLEEEGRRNWIAQENRGDLSVNVGRSGGGV
ncbi:uncharacterized protein HMPREF1541_03916 [Cyphellophora europaea CBS 101466]|uniref:Uncharacterized protein n=1 Tax=Cyphellophora europaea (strain CBS 101466) TaxID=1220924 RepID=W2RZX3_CYPE1|nr:uncharacterized protein HMPREF1541_03916 [Cyphellophora europaea CBS 101466]ETN41977.1 hypothetical protein HMPREF1541_03916 [Cyphellophora europaea CBS 101466]